MNEDDDITYPDSGANRNRKELRQLRDVVKSLTPTKSPGTLLARTSMGVIRRGNPRSVQSSTGGGDAVWL